MSKEIFSNKQKYNSETFSYSHLKAVAVCAFMLLFLTLLKSGFDFSFFSFQKIQDQSVLTFEQLKKQFTNNYDSGISSNTTKDQLALIDPSINSGGEVLGLTTDSDINLPPVEEVFTEETLNKIHIQTYPGPSTEKQVQKYSEDILLVDSKNDSLGILTSLNTGDEASLQKVISDSNLIISSLSTLPVPQDLQKFHKYRMLYFLSIQKIAESFLATGTNSSVENYSIIFFSIIEGMEKERGIILEKYNVEL